LDTEGSGRRERTRKTSFGYVKDDRSKKSSDLSRDDAQDKDDWRVRLKGTTG